MQKTTFDEALDVILVNEKRYHRDSYLFLRDALDHTRKMLDRDTKSDLHKRSVDKESREQHVSGQELLEGIRELALQTFGPMAITVFEEWGITRCEDFGELVFSMVENGLLRKTEKDTREDFRNGYDFTEAFRLPFLPKGKLPKTPSSETAAR
jgi:uncharacterized repeat protein (TIGR04138 family)